MTRSSHGDLIHVELGQWWLTPCDDAPAEYPVLVLGFRDRATVVGRDLKGDEHELAVGSLTNQVRRSDLAGCFDPLRVMATMKQQSDVVRSAAGMLPLPDIIHGERTLPRGVNPQGAHVLGLLAMPGRETITPAEAQKALGLAKCPTRTFNSLADAGYLRLHPLTDGRDEPRRQAWEATPRGRGAIMGLFGTPLEPGLGKPADTQETTR
jgi:hypothetical protein